MQLPPRALALATAIALLFATSVASGVESAPDHPPKLLPDRIEEWSTPMEPVEEVDPKGQDAVFPIDLAVNNRPDTCNFVVGNLHQMFPNFLVVNRAR